MISKKVRELFVSLMEASDDSAVSYDIETEQYSGFFNNTVVDKYIELGALRIGRRRRWRYHHFDQQQR